jgi:glycosyltransferase involved in cell wall biosynthesis
MITIITSTLNCENNIKNLAISLENQTNKDFIWFVVDGLSKDSTLEIVNNTKVNKIIISETDFGVYDALNKALKRVTTEYYIVCGSDDVLFPNAIADFKSVCTQYDIVSCAVMMNGKVAKPRKVPRRIALQMSLISAHAVGTCIKLSLHKELGYYDKRYWMVADAHFIMKADQAKKKFGFCDKVVGEYGTDGESAQYYISALTGSLRIEIEDLKWNPYISLLIFNLKMIKNLISRSIFK